MHPYVCVCVCLKPEWASSGAISRCLAGEARSDDGRVLTGMSGRASWTRVDSWFASQALVHTSRLHRLFLATAPRRRNFVDTSSTRKQRRQRCRAELRVSNIWFCLPLACAHRLRLSPPVRARILQRARKLPTLLHLQRRCKSPHRWECSHLFAGVFLAVSCLQGRFPGFLEFVARISLHMVDICPKPPASLLPIALVPLLMAGHSEKSCPPWGTCAGVWL